MVRSKKCSLFLFSLFLLIFSMSCVTTPTNNSSRDYKQELIDAIKKSNTIYIFAKPTLTSLKDTTAYSDPRATKWAVPVPSEFSAIVPEVVQKLTKAFSNKQVVIISDHLQAVEGVVLDVTMSGNMYTTNVGNGNYDFGIFCELQVFDPSTEEYYPISVTRILGKEDKRTVVVAGGIRGTFNRKNSNAAIQATISQSIFEKERNATLIKQQFNKDLDAFLRYFL